MIERVCLVLSLSLLSACATYSGRGVPAPVEDRGTGTVVTPATSPRPDAVSSVTRAVENTPEPVRDTRPADETPIVRSPSTVNPAPTVPALPAVPATASSTLLAGVDAAIAEGDLERAAALCERALRITPREALLWYRLASVRAQQGRVNEAEGFARRALSFSATDPALTRQINGFLQGL